MTSPFDYRIDVANPLESAVKGYQIGAGIQDHQLQQQQKQAAFQQQQEQQRALRALISNPNAGAKEYADATLLAPGMREQLKQAWDTKNTAQQQSHLSDLSQWSAAIQNGKPEIASEAMRQRADAMEATAGGPTPESQAMRANAKVVQEHPQFANNAVIKPMIFAHPDGGKVIDSIAKLGSERRADQLQTGLVDKGVAEAITAQNAAVTSGAGAQVAAATVPALSEKPALDNQIATLNAQINAADSETKRGQLTLERDKLMATQGLAAVEKGEGAQAQIDSAQHALNTIASLRADPLMKKSTGNYLAGIGTVMGRLLGSVPGTENKDFRGQLESLKSQVFLPAVQQVKGMGALSNAEGEKLTAAVASLDADMKPNSLLNALGVVERYMTKGLQKGLSSKAVPTQGGGFVISHPSFGKVSEGDINRVMKDHPGATRAQVLQYLQSTGAK